MPEYENKEGGLIDGSVVSIFSEITCGEACWHAKEEICKCSCGGKNHGILKTVDGIQPVRTCRITGNRYELVSVGNWADGYNEGMELLKPHNPRAVHKINSQLTYTYKWELTDNGAPYRLRPASRPQISNWAELAPYREMSRIDLYRAAPALLWKRI